MADFDAMRAAVPYKDSVMFTIIRDPSAVFESLFGFLGYARTYAMTYLEFIEEIRNTTVLSAVRDTKSRNFYTYVLSHLSSNDIRTFSKKSRHLWSWNPLMFDLGTELPSFVNASERDVAEMILKMDRQLDFVMIADRMDESLVLLKDIMCWTWEDVVSLLLHVVV